MKKKIIFFLYVVYFLMAFKGYLYSGDQFLPNELSLDSYAQSFIRVFAYGAVESGLTVMNFLPNKVIAQTDSFKLVEVNTNLSLVDIVRLYPTTNPQPGYCDPAFQTLNYYLNARLIGLINNITEVRKPLGYRYLLFPVRYKKEGHKAIERGVIKWNKKPLHNPLYQGKSIP